MERIGLTVLDVVHVSGGKTVEKEVQVISLRSQGKVLAWFIGITFHLYTVLSVESARKCPVRAIRANCSGKHYLGWRSRPRINS